MTMPNQKKLFFENLDGLRFFCFLAVFFFHSFFTNSETISSSATYDFIKKDIFGNGNLGVNFFFVLSGFLITYLLIEERKLNRKIDIKNFWLRRILRIWPLYFFCVFFGFVLFPLIKQFFGMEGSETADPIYYLTFISNFDLLKNGLPDASVLGVLWSIAIEEQFYFVWPIILSIFPVRNYWIPFMTVIMGSLIFRFFYPSELIHEYHTFSCMGDLAMGATGAWLMQTSPKFATSINKIPRGGILFLYLFFIAIFFFRDELLFWFPWTRSFERMLIAMVIVLIILEQCFAERSIIKMSRFKIISRLGTITYGLYCLHFIGILIAITITAKLKLNLQLWQVVLIDTPLALLMSIAISLISYQFFEKPFLKLKKRFAYITK